MVNTELHYRIIMVQGNGSPIYNKPVLFCRNMARFIIN